jgi:hypothetical protein
MSAGASISGIGGLFYMVMLIVGICTSKGKKLKSEQMYYTIILIISFTLFISLLSIIFEFQMVSTQWNIS